MIRGRFTAVIHGEFETSGPSVLPVIAVVLAVAFVSWLLTVLLLLAVIAGGVMLILGAAAWLLSRRNDRDMELLAERTAALHAEVAAKAAPVAVQNHYHLHLPPGASAQGDWAALPLRDAVTITEEE